MGFWNKRKKYIHEGLHRIYDEEELLKSNMEEAEEIERLLNEMNDDLNETETEHDEAALKQTVEEIITKARRDSQETKALLDQAAKKIKELKK